MSARGLNSESKPCYFSLARPFLWAQRDPEETGHGPSGGGGAGEGERRDPVTATC